MSDPILHGKQNEKDLLERYRVIMQTAMDGFWLVDTQGRFLEVNETYCQMIGYSQSELLTMRVSDVEAVETPEMNAAHIQNIIAAGKNRFETRHRRKDGKIIDIEVNSRFYPDKQGLIVCFLKDITEYKQTLNALEENRKQLALAMDLALAVHWEFDVISQIFTFNDRFYALYATTAEQEGGYKMTAENYARNFLFPEDISLVAGEIERAIMEPDLNAKWEVEHRILRRDGQIRYISVRMTVIKDAQGRTVRTRGVNQDITERKQNEEMLRFHSLLLNHMIEGVLLVQIKDLTIVYVNPAFAKMFGYSSEELIGKPVAILSSPDDYLHEKIMEKIDLSMKTTGQWQGRIRNCKKNGTFFWTSAVMSSFQHPIYGDVGLMVQHDISEIVDLENTKEKLQTQSYQTQKMEAVGQLAGGVAHDFNNMLGVILGYCELILEMIGPSNPIYADLMEISRAAEHSKELTRQLLGFARKQTISPKVMNLNDAIEGIMKLMRRLIGENIELIWQPDPDLWLIKMDPSQIDQILMNLAVNSRDAISEHGKIIITTENVVQDEAIMPESENQGNREYVMLTLSDNGQGMEKEILDHLFEPFFTTKNVGQGTGLGLATVYGIVKQNQGFILAESETGKGSTFKCYIPRHTGNTTQLEMRPSELSKSRGETVLVVEDEAALLRLTTALLRRLGYQVLPANSPDEAIRLATTHTGMIHLLLTDVIMPEMTGRELATLLVAANPGLKLLFMSGYTADVIAHQGVLDEGVSFINKPFSLKTLAVKLREILD
ncbi:MAG: PAS domain S-box protein [Candidatus Riflebacteria bacterium]|nr:PAS domain S-box protein [Candidatus Riflebacteria bacterium]